MSGSVGVVPEVQGTLEVVFYCERHEEEAIYKQALHAALGTHLESVSSDTQPVVESGQAWPTYNKNHNE